MFGETFFTLRLAVTGAASRDATMATAVGWWTERFAREKVLSPLSAYLDVEADEEVDEAARLRSWAQGIEAKFAPQAPHSA